MGVSLNRLQDPIKIALNKYQEISDSGLVFDSREACKLIPTPTKPNSARSETDVLFNGDKVGKLYVIAFKPGDGSGSEVNYKLDELKIDAQYPRVIQIVPRNKTGIYNEGHLTIASHKIEDVHAESRLFGGTFDLLGLVGKQITKIGQLGQSEQQDQFTPLTTLTVGYHNSERFGDPHAVYSKIPDSIQVCAFLAISDEVQKLHPNILDSLNPKLP